MLLLHKRVFFPFEKMCVDAMSWTSDKLVICQDNILEETADTVVSKYQ